jgi:BirA family biotin operon repressor/biotin-[acetyl-CoA-carboxylase] ligase
VLSLALEELFGLKTALKWPNDLIYQKGKCGGLLLENRRGALIAGIGLNLTSPPPMPQIRNPLAPPAGALPGEIGPPRRLWLEVAQWVLMDYNKRLYARSENWSRTIIDQAERRLLGLGQMVTIHNPSTQPPASVPALSGKLTGLAPGGALTLEGPFGQVAVWSGTLTLNPGNFESP